MLPGFLFFLSLWGFFLIKKHLILLLISIELMLLSVNLNLVIFSVFLEDFVGQFLALFILTVAASESAIGLAILLIYYRLRGTIFINFINILKG
jgi:NADH:ubiquinone oxidoreductase subunit 11 or 4L (chain K)